MTSAQVAVGSDVGQLTPQINTERGSVPTTIQLSSGRSTEASVALSRPADGRVVTTTRVAGTDRCDPSANNAGVAICSRVIETRSRDYARPSPLILSPEQRLLVDQRVRAGLSGGDGGSPRPGDAERADPDTTQGQTVAAIVRRDDVGDAANAAATADLPPGVSPEALIVIDAILNQPPPK